MVRGEGNSGMDTDVDGGFPEIRRKRRKGGEEGEEEKEEEEEEGLGLGS